MDDLVDLAEDLLGDEAELYRRVFPRAALKRKLKDAIRRWRDDQEEPQLDLLGDFKGRRLPVPMEDGGYAYRPIGRMVFRDLLALRAGRHDVAVRGRADLWQLDKIIEGVEPIMAGDPEMILDEALAQLKERPPPEEQPEAPVAGTTEDQPTAE